MIKMKFDKKLIVAILYRAKHHKWDTLILLLNE